MPRKAKSPPPDELPEIPPAVQQMDLTSPAQNDWDQGSWNYELAVARVEAIVEQIEAGDLELADLFDRFETAVAYLRQCEIFLKDKQQQMDLMVEILEGKTTANNPH